MENNPKNDTAALLNAVEVIRVLGGIVRQRPIKYARDAGLEESWADSGKQAV